MSQFQEAFKRRLGIISDMTLWSDTLKLWQGTRISSVVSGERMNQSTSKSDDKTKEEMIKEHSNSDNLSENCICGHWNQKKCLIVNVTNSIQIWIGADCYQHINPERYEFLKKASQSLYTMRQHSLDHTHRCNKEALNYSESRSVISSEENDFMISIGKKRKLSDKQISKINVIKRKILQDYIYTTITEPSPEPPPEPSPEPHQEIVSDQDKCQCGRLKKKGYRQCYYCYKKLHTCLL